MFNSAWFKSRCEFTVIFKSRPIASKSRHSYDIPHALHVHVADFQGNFWNGEAANAAANFILFRNGQHRTQCKALDGHTVRNYCCLNALHTALAWLVCVFAHISFSITPLYNIQLVFSMHHPSSFPPPPCRPSWSSWTCLWQPLVSSCLPRDPSVSMTIRNAKANFTSERTASDRFPVPKVSLKSATCRCKAYGISSLWRDLLAMSRDLEMPHFSQRDLERGWVKHIII